MCTSAQSPAAVTCKTGTLIPFQHVLLVPWYRSCISRSPNAPADCEGDDCNVYIEE